MTGAQAEHGQPSGAGQQGLGLQFSPINTNFQTRLGVMGCSVCPAGHIRAPGKAGPGCRCLGYTAPGADGTEDGALPPAPAVPPPGSTCAGVTHLDLSESRLGQHLGESDQQCPATCHLQSPAFVVLGTTDKVALVSTGSGHAWVPRN